MNFKDVTFKNHVFKLSDIFCEFLNIFLSTYQSLSPMNMGLGARIPRVE